MVICNCGRELKKITKKHLQSKTHIKLVLEQSKSFNNLGLKHKKMDILVLKWN